jgi:hypothetical protein
MRGYVILLLMLTDIIIEGSKSWLWATTSGKRAFDVNVEGKSSPSGRHLRKSSRPSSHPGG